MTQIRIGKFISEMRKKKGLTQSQLADILYVSDKAISKWETDKGFPEITTLVLLCNTLEINLNELLSGEIISDNDYKSFPDINGFLKDLIKLSTTDTIVPAEEFFELFAVRIRLSTLNCKEIVENIIYLQGYMYILQGDTSDMVRKKLSIFIKDIQ